MLDPRVIGDVHYQTARATQKLLQDYKGLQDIIAILGTVCALCDVFAVFVGGGGVVRWYANSAILIQRACNLPTAMHAIVRASILMFIACTLLITNCKL